MGKRLPKKVREKIKEHGKLAREAIEQANFIFIVTDARFVNDSRDLEIEEEAKKKGKKVVLIVNKIDLVSNRFLKKLKNYLEKRGEDYILVSAKKRFWFRKLRKMIDKYKHEFQEKGKGKLKIAIIGYTNVGKSTLINTLKGRYSCRTSPTPKFTKGLQWIRLSKGVLLIDSPGTLNFKGISLYLLGLDPAKATWKEGKRLYEILKEKCSDFDKKTYNIESENFDEFLEKLAKKYNFIRKYSKVDKERALKKFINDWNKGKIKAWWI